MGYPMAGHLIKINEVTVYNRTVSKAQKWIKEHNGKFISVKEDDILEIGLNRAVDLIFNHSSKESSKTPSAGRFSKFKQASKSTVKKAVTKKSPSKTSKTTVKKTKK